MEGIEVPGHLNTFSLAWIADVALLFGAGDYRVAGHPGCDQITCHQTPIVVHHHRGSGNLGMTRWVAEGAFERHRSGPYPNVEIRKVVRRTICRPQMAFDHPIAFSHVKLADAVVGKD